MCGLVGDLRRTRLCCSGSERRRICTGDHPSALSKSVTSVKAVVASEESRCMQRRRHTLRTTDTPTHHAQWEAIAHDRPSHPPQTPRRTGGGRQNPTHTGAAQTPYTSALARCGRRSPLSYRLFNGGVRPRAAPSRSRRETSEPHAMRACAMAPLAPCLSQID